MDQPTKQGREEQEAAYRRGYLTGFEEAGLLVLQLVELGYKTRVIKQLLAVYDDHFPCSLATRKPE